MPLLQTPLFVPHRRTLRCCLLMRLAPPPTLPCSITSWGAPDGQKSLVFASVFVLVWLGASVVTVNAQLLGGKLCVKVGGALVL